MPKMIPNAAAPKRLAEIALPLTLDAETRGAIVRAINSHDALVAALKQCQDALLGYDGLSGDPERHNGWSDPAGHEAYMAATEAIAQAEVTT